MDLAFLSNLRKIIDEDNRLVTITLLIDTISNLINDRNNHRHKILPASYVREIFQQYLGAMQCLNAIGFKQVNDDYVFDQTTSDKHLQETVKLLENELDSKPICQSEQIQCQSIDHLGIIDDEKTAAKSISFNNLRLPSQFAKLIPFTSTIQCVQSYEDPTLRRYIRSSIIPLEDFNRRISKKTNSTDVNIRDLLLLELLRWFKEEFFTWFDRPTCQRCKIPMEFANYSQASREEREQGDAHRVELYRCSTCSSEYRFPRYNAPSKLLETRCGRCGEAANLFACLCRALSFPTRYIHDPSDHVWTEVYSASEQRWIHCDACENLCDSPLVYEKGWKKELSFCIAFAKDHIEDVTWRYVTNFQQTIQKRNVNERTFARIIHRLNGRLQSQLSQEEKLKITSNQIKDIVSMLNEEKSAKESELHGRQSGSLSWKLSRGETDQQDDITQGYIYLLTKPECANGLITIDYNSVLDKYSRNEMVEDKKDGWIDRVYSCSNVQRKVERDWKKVYLSRKQVHREGILSWVMQFKPEEEKLYRFERITIQCPSTTFDQFARIICQLQIGDEEIIDLSANSAASSNSSFEYVLENRNNSLADVRINFKVILTSSNDNNDENAWQKGQLFRQATEQISDDDRSHFLRIRATIVKRDTNL